MLLFDFLQYGRTVNADKYCARLKKKPCDGPSGEYVLVLSNGINFRLDNDRPHSVRQALNFETIVSSAGRRPTCYDQVADTIRI